MYYKSELDYSQVKDNCDWLKQAIIDEVKKLKYKHAQEPFKEAIAYNTAINDVIAKIESM